MNYRLLITLLIAYSPMSAMFSHAEAGNLTGAWKGPQDLMINPEMPDNLNHALEGTILPTDYGVLSLDREKAQEVLSAVTAGSIGYAEKRVVEKLISAKTHPISPKDMIGFKQVRSIQIDARYGIFSYRISIADSRRLTGKYFLRKQKGASANQDLCIKTALNRLYSLVDGA